MGPSGAVWDLLGLSGIVLDSLGFAGIFWDSYRILLDSLKFSEILGFSLILLNSVGSF